MSGREPSREPAWSSPIDAMRCDAFSISGKLCSPQESSSIQPQDAEPTHSPR